MRIAIIAVGTRGSVQPFVALGRGLSAAGHQVTIATSTNLRSLAQEGGLSRIVAVVGDTRRWTAWLARGRSREKPQVLLPKLARRPGQLRGMLEEFFANTVPVVRGADLVISSAPGYCVGQPIAERFGVPHYSAFLQPFHPTRAFSQMFWPQFPDRARIGRELYNIATHRATLSLLRRLLGRALDDACRKVLGPGKHSYHSDPLVMYGYSPALIAKPRDWGPHIHVTGYWVLEQPSAWEPPAELDDFLRSGPAPVYIGLGSLAEVREEILDIAVDALRRSGQRGIIASGWSAWRPAREDDDLYVVDDIPHEWLFPRTRAVVHHAGVGTVGASLRAGTPTITVPVMYDHFLFAHQVHKAGLGPRPLPLRTMTPGQLSAAIDFTVGDAAFRSRADEVGRRVRSERGVQRATELIHEYGAQ